jgi:hypothetical protein
LTNTTAIPIPSRNYHQLALQAMVFQHGLLSLPIASHDAGEENSPYSTAEGQINDITRINLMIYSVMVIFPCCPSYRVKQRLVAILRAGLEGFFQ